MTVTVSPDEQRETGEYAESVTVYEYVVLTSGDAEYVAEDVDGIALVHVPSEYHW